MSEARGALIKRGLKEAGADVAQTGPRSREVVPRHCPSTPHRDALAGRGHPGASGRSVLDVLDTGVCEIKSGQKYCCPLGGGGSRGAGQPPVHTPGWWLPRTVGSPRSSRKGVAAEGCARLLISLKWPQMVVICLNTARWHLGPGPGVATPSAPQRQLPPSCLSHRELRAPGPSADVQHSRRLLTSHDGRRGRRPLPPPPRLSAGRGAGRGGSRGDRD